MEKKIEKKMESKFITEECYRLHKKWGSKFWECIFNQGIDDGLTVDEYKLPIEILDSYFEEIKWGKEYVNYLVTLIGSHSWFGIPGARGCTGAPIPPQTRIQRSCRKLVATCNSSYSYDIKSQEDYYSNKMFNYSSIQQLTIIMLRLIFTSGSGCSPIVKGLINKITDIKLRDLLNRIPKNQGGYSCMGTRSEEGEKQRVIKYKRQEIIIKLIPELSIEKIYELLEKEVSTDIK